VPNLLISRILDRVDDQQRLHHGYAFLYIGNIEATSTKQIVEAFVVDSTKVLLEIPSVSGSLLNHFGAVEQQLLNGVVGGDYSEPLSKSHNTLVDQLTTHNRLQKYRVLVEFNNNEELTNVPFGGSEGQFGEIPPLVRAVNHAVRHHDKEIPVFEMYMVFEVARVENETRKEKTTARHQSNPAADALKAKLQGMQLN